MKIDAIIFDAYGTLFDVHTVAERCEQFFPGQGDSISQRWRQKQLEYTWLRSLMNKYEDFWRITSDSLLFTLKEMKLQASEVVQQTILNEYLTLEPFSEVTESLKKLSVKKLAILSNGSPNMLNKVVKHADLTNYFSKVISVDELKIYKPSMTVYQLAVEKLAVKKQNALFVTSNPWDASGAKTFGYKVCWINRNNANFDELDVFPDIIIKSLDELN